MNLHKRGDDMNKIKMLRLKNNLTQYDVAKALNISRVAVTQWENNKTFPKRKRMFQLAKVLKCKPADLL